MIAWMLLQWAAGLHGAHVGYQHYTDWVLHLVPLVVVWRTLRALVDQRERYWLPVWQGLLHGLVATLVAATVYQIFLTLYLHFLNPNFPDLYLEWHVAQMRAAGVAEENVRAIAREFRWSTSPVGVLLTVVGTNLLIGFLAAPLLTLWLNWRRKEFARAN